MKYFLTILFVFSAIASARNLTEADARNFLNQIQAQLQASQMQATRADWIYKNFITLDTAENLSILSERHSAARLKAALEAGQFDRVGMDADTARQMRLLKNAILLPPPQDAAKSREMAAIMTQLEGMYSTGKYCRDADNCLNLPEMTLRMAQSRDPKELLELWAGWREIAPPMAPMYAQQVSLMNEGALSLGYDDTGELWRGQFDMSAAKFSREVNRLWRDVRPLYNALHCHVRAQLSDFYGADLVSETGPLPAHLLGNMWAQSWGNVYDLVTPPTTGSRLDVGQLMHKKGIDEAGLVKIAEGFFTSIGLRALPESFYERSLLVKPQDREVACHASAYNINQQDDVRIKMCIQMTSEDFDTVHHELGHDYYFLSYNHLPWVYRQSANNGFHEAVGDTIALSVTPTYLHQIGLLDALPESGNDLNFLMRQALDKIAFLPFGLLMDQWRWRVFSGKVSPANYNSYWWKLREKYQGVVAPVARNADHFDPGAKYHIPNNTPYIRYFLSYILQFQFQQALCDAAGYRGPLHGCSIYGNHQAGERLGAMMAMGSSKPWQDALEVLTGSRKMNAGAIKSYFAPLKSWLDKQNSTRQCGW